MSEEEVIKSEEVKLCELCKEQPASMLCSECYKCYCSECNEYMHRKASMKRHKIESLFEGVKINARCPIHSDNQFELFCVDEIKLCCPMCEREKLHEGHNVVKMTEITKDNEVFSSSKVRKRFADVLKCDNELHKKIELAMEIIRKEGGSAKENVKQTFIEAHKKLDEEEAKIMMELERICTENEEALQNNLKALKDVCEYSKILNGVDSSIRGKSSRLMELSLVSEMEKQRRAMEDLHKMKMTNLKIEWDNEKRKLSFIKTLFNGAPIPHNISFPSISGKRFDVSWDCDENEFSEEEEENAKIKYIIEVKKLSEEEKEWKEVHSGTEKKCTVNGLEKDTEYNVRVKCIIGGLQGVWSNVVNVRTKNYGNKMESSILSKETNKSMFIGKLSEWCKTTDFELLYRGSRDGFGANRFHDECDGQGKTLILVQDTSGLIFGGFASIPWSSSNAYKKAPGSFLFTLANTYNAQPTKFSLKNENDKHAVCHYSNYGPTFGDGHDLYISSGCNNNDESYSDFSAYNDTTRKGYSIFSSNTEDSCFQVQEIEVFKINV